jgi:hypothetical protein
MIVGKITIWADSQLGKIGQPDSANGGDQNGRATIRRTWTNVHERIRM